MLSCRARLPGPMSSERPRLLTQGPPVEALPGARITPSSWRGGVRWRHASRRGQHSAARHALADPEGNEPAPSARRQARYRQGGERWAGVRTTLGRAVAGPRPERPFAGALYLLVCHAQLLQQGGEFVIVEISFREGFCLESTRLT